MSGWSLSVRPSGLCRLRRSGCWEGRPLGGRLAVDPGGFFGRKQRIAQGVRACADGLIRTCGRHRDRQRRAHHNRPTPVPAIANIAAYTAPCATMDTRSLSQLLCSNGSPSRAAQQASLIGQTKGVHLGNRSVLLCSQSRNFCNTIQNIMH